MNDDTEDTQAIDPTSPAQAADEADDTPEPEGQESEAPPPEGAEPPAEPAQDDDESSTDTEDQTPDPNTVDVVGVKPPTAQDLNNHDMQFQQDLARGMIKPETYQSLFAKKDTLGKIGTLFGLLVSGAGSGLAHQSNAVMDMMNRQIQNDFEAQKASNENAQNWVRLSQAHALQEAQIPSLKAQTALATAKAGQVPSETAEMAARAENLKADTLFKGSNTAINKARLGAVQHLSDQVDKIPPTSPVKGPAVSALQQVSQGVQAENAQNNLATASHLNTRAAMRGELPPPMDSGIDDKKLLLMQQLGSQAASLGVVDPRGIMPADLPTISTQAGQVKMNRATYASYIDSFKKMNNAFLSGKLNPSLYNAEVGNFQSSLAKQIGEQGATESVKGMFPDIKDWGGARSEKFAKTSEHFKTNEAGTDALDKYGLKTPFPDVPNPAAPKPSSNISQASPTVKKMGGVSYQKVGNSWRKVNN